MSNTTITKKQCIAIAFLIGCKNSEQTKIGGQLMNYHCVHNPICLTCTHERWLTTYPTWRSAQRAIISATRRATQLGVKYKVFFRLINIPEPKARAPTVT